MIKSISGMVVTGAVALAAVNIGCHGDREQSYNDQRPPPDALVGGNTGIQAKDVTAATDRMAGDLLAQPRLNASPRQWTIVITGVQNHDSTDPTLSYEAFNGRLRSRLAQLGQGRVALIENRAVYQGLQREREPTADGSGGAAGIQPDFGLYITVDSLPGRASDYFNITGILTNLRTREQVWVSPTYEFQSAR